ncbi:TRAP transporter substrate-binding protein [Halomonas daqingensis]|uniref:TRAP transporter substrate-binding protein n=1 Tax=Billgrantia desiderata TaxID=52021 RepID=A0AAW4YS76_9GAMM|nr:TRAP transporter substrate-binding protein [Halomonas desiderata]MCE8012517.1 TRAP transporter substrate-binding protein [Halomonas desiderata]MCE8027727.1 TRAP transporter substrate-binding protein [Halomonas desiderata]MCE8051289.1 TRAP transporter substrate-binding protein [Halomonas desiderata]NIC38665.1 TRAP transporter substrate-binding protein [Halomonas desiderata]OUE40911.1 ABC transporter substrate-binding protein [Halomonas desiderata SP1]
MLKRTALVTAVSAALMASAAQASALSIQVLGQPAGSGLIAQQKEQPFFTNLAENTGLDITVQYLPVDVAGVPDTDGLRVLRSGLFDIVSLRGPQVSRDEPSILGLDLIGLNTSFEAGREHVAAFYDYVDNRLQERFNAKLLGTWPAGPQVIFCRGEIGGLDDLRGKRVRVGDQSAANFVGQLGATGISMPFGDVQQSLSRGVIDCAITGPASANSGGWPEATTTVLPIALQLAINGYAINLDTWNSMTEEQQTQLESAIAELSDEIWTYSEELYEDAMRCNAGETPCEYGTLYSLTEVPVTEEDLAKVAAAVEEVSLPIWARQCNAAAADCEDVWRDTVGQKLGL